MVILLVEDDPGDVLLTREAFEEDKTTKIRVVQDGSEAMAYLRQEGEYAGAPRPDLVLLDLSLPRMNGHEVLAEIKGDDALKSIPVVVLSVSVADEDLLRAYDNHANCFISKRENLGEFRDAVKAVEHFWFKIAELPPR